MWVQKREEGGGIEGGGGGGGGGVGGGRGGGGGGVGGGGGGGWGLVSLLPENSTRSDKRVNKCGFDHSELLTPTESATKKLLFDTSFKNCT